ncbi:hypothetical protein MAM1_0038d02749 [Mucor ambiguus]|uniref:Uncharacterized protein n=1 Tax=Mucor ambiguus TaxID=91626 RepID=A0A0C9M358_9FUNG|nr:hypothetical protein MAM1_0038d02749 [Mucor ambiguus]
MLSSRQPTSTLFTAIFKDKNEGDAVDSKANNNGTANAVEAKVIHGHAEQEAIDQMMLPYLQLQNTVKFEYTRDMISQARSCFRPSE